MTVRAVVAAWSGSARARRSAQALVLAGAATLALQNTATLNVGFTLRVPDLLLGLALLAGLPFALHGLLRLPPWLLWPSVGLVVIYALSTATTHIATIPGDPRAGDLRAVVYLGNLVEGIGVMSLALGLWPSLGAARGLIGAYTAGAAVAAAYAIWQWPAQRYGLPLHNVITTLDSNGVTSGASQGRGILGWQRVRGTFLEPHFLGAFMAGAAPLAYVAATQLEHRRRSLALAASAAMLLALLLAASAPAWASFALAALVACATFAIGRGRSVLAGILASVACLAVLASPLLLVAPGRLAAATGRNSTELTVTAQFRKDTWSRILDIWATRPVQGHGAGQSSVRLTLDSEGSTPAALQSAQGLWAAALVDVGIVGLALWLTLAGGVVALALGRLLRHPTAVDAALLVALLSALFTAFVTNDRLDLAIWLLFGIVAVRNRRAPAQATARLREAIVNAATPARPTTAPPTAP